VKSGKKKLNKAYAEVKAGKQVAYQQAPSSQEITPESFSKMSDRERVGRAIAPDSQA
jgi:hypothetical protein